MYTNSRLIYLWHNLQLLPLLNILTLSNRTLKLSQNLAIQWLRIKSAHHHTKLI
jgi:hypothetical protein